MPRSAAQRRQPQRPGASTYEAFEIFGTALPEKIGVCMHKHLTFSIQAP
jgi:hypothetical protein